MLKRDLTNGPNHCFGNHDKCSPDFCTTARERLSRDDSHQTQDTPEPVEDIDDDNDDILGEFISKKDKWQLYISHNNVNTQLQFFYRIFVVNYYLFKTLVIFIFANNAGVIEDQEQIWRETTADDPTSEINVLRGGQVGTDVNPALYHDIQVILSRLVAKGNQLIDNVTTNLAESWMHIRAKFDRGKVINRCQSGSWEHRCMGAGLQQNIGREWGPGVWKKMTCSSPNKVFTNAAEHSAKKASKEKKRKASEEVKQKRRKSKYSRTGESSEARKAYRHSCIAPKDTSVTS